MAAITWWFVLGTIGMVVGTAALAIGVSTLERDRRTQMLHIAGVPAIAAVAYALMALDVGGIQTLSSDLIYVPRYFDWLLTTPLHVAYIGLIAGLDRRERWGLAGLQGAVIVLGFLGGVLAGLPKIAFFGAGSIVYVVLIYRLRTTGRASAEKRGVETAGLYRKLLNFVIVLWAVYPVIWILAPTGIGAMDTETASLVITYIDVVAKVGFGAIAIEGQRVLTQVASAEQAGTDQVGA
ncbi:bacteriorhodopsin [Halococcoides cellulosivorans]|uniref:bacteriorhodopsin n=1 Tax=Halococcoides cellulosivorans TaxID=1679096 RepID=UPI001F20535D|nr:bacteriorhodopsin [Halococcoides cellulosivorans]